MDDVRVWEALTEEENEAMHVVFDCIICSEKPSTDFVRHAF
jgi:hypothetical protein